MSVQFACPHCGQLLRADQGLVGQAVQCARCQGGVLVPPSQQTDLPFSEELDPVAEEHTDASVESRSDQVDTLPSDPEHEEPQAGSRFSSAPGSAYVELSRMAIYTIGGLIAGVAVICFLLGWSFGSELAANKTAAGESVSRRISGQISYVTSRGKLAPDSEAVVIAFPTKSKPDQKLEPAGLRPEIAPADVSAVMRKAVRALGGDFDRTDRNGVYEVEVPSPGEYYLLVISSHRTRRGGLQPTTREVVEIGQFVTRATELLKDNDFVWSKQLVTKTRSYDHLFGEE